MIMHAVIVMAVAGFAISASLVTATATALQEGRRNTLNAVEVRGDDDDTGIILQNNATAVAARFIQDYVTKAVCSFSPEFCAKHKLQSRGIQSYLATAGTLFAGVLGVILTKIKILVVLSLMTTIIGKILLFYAFLHSHPHNPTHYHHHKPHHHVPFVKYTKDKYYIKNTPTEQSHDVIVDHDSHHTPYHSQHPSGGVSYYKR